MEKIGDRLQTYPVRGRLMMMTVYF